MLANASYLWTNLNVCMFFNFVLHHIFAIFVFVCLLSRHMFICVSFSYNIPLSQLCLIFHPFDFFLSPVCPTWIKNYFHPIRGILIGRNLSMHIMLVFGNMY